MHPPSRDETAPLLAPHDEGQNHCGSSGLNSDSEWPQHWSKTFKWTITTLLAFMAFTVTFNCISVVPIASRIVKDLSGETESSKSASVLLVTIWELGEAAGPLFLAPLSETFGRWPVINIANGCFVAATALAALCQTTPLFIAARALSGLVVTANVLNPAVMGDIWEAENRGSPMSLMTLGPFIGGTAGPAISGLISEQLSWRWVLWMSVVLSGTCAILLFTSLPETYGPVILRRKNKRLHLLAENGVPEPPVGGEKGSYAELVESIARPGIVFVSSSVLMALSLWSSVAFAHYYNMATTLPGILEDLYGLSPALTGSAMLFFSIGSAISTFVCNSKLDSLYIKLRDANGGIGQPEFRLPLAILGALTQPFFYAAYGWIAHFHLPLPLLFINIGFMGATLSITMLPMYAYVVDAFGLYSASAMTGVIVSRCLMGTFLPLTSTPLIENLGYGWGLSVPAGLGLLLAPIPIFTMKYGQQWRQRCPYSRNE